MYETIVEKITLRREVYDTKMKNKQLSIGQNRDTAEGKKKKNKQTKIKQTETIKS